MKRKYISPQSVLTLIGTDHNVMTIVVQSDPNKLDGGTSTKVDGYSQEGDGEDEDGDGTVDDMAKWQKFSIWDDEL